MDNKRKRTSTSSDDDQPREDVLNCKDYFMHTAFLAGRRSWKPSTKVGACIVEGNERIVSTGYNSMLNGRTDDTIPLDFYVCHAGMNAIMNSNGRDLKNCTMYVTLFPCNECAKIIIQSGISKVIYESNENSGKDTTEAAKQMFDEADITLRQYTRTDPTVTGLKSSNI